MHVRVRVFTTDTNPTLSPVLITFTYFFLQNPVSNMREFFKILRFLVFSALRKKHLGILNVLAKYWCLPVLDSTTYINSRQPAPPERG